MDDESKFEEVSKKIHAAIDAQVECTGRNTDAILDGILELQRILKRLKHENEELKKQNEFYEKCIWAMNS